MKINVIVAYSKEYIIGKNQTIPWIYKEDLKYFQKITKEVSDKNKKNIVIMGYNTHTSIPNQMLKDRINIVITTKQLEDKDDLYFKDSLGSTMELCQELTNKKLVEKIFVIGGETIYNYFFKSYYYKYLDKVYITFIDKEYDGNKYFYGLEEKFYYVSIKKSELHQEIEYRVLKYDENFYNPESKYYEHLQKMIKFPENILNIENNLIMNQKFNFNLKLELFKYFPIFSIIKDKMNKILNDIFIILKNDILKDNINTLINKIKNNEKSNLYINLFDILPNESIYYYSIKDNKLCCNVYHKKGNLLGDILINIIFSCLLLRLISILSNLETNICYYTCIESYFYKKDTNLVEKIIWDTPDVLCLLDINNTEKERIEDFTINDLSFTGLNIF
jgi:dihydrofolate reductase